jgi:hypothetical protein
VCICISTAHTPAWRSAWLVKHKDNFTFYACTSYLLTLVLRSRISLPWRWRRYDPPKRRFNRPHLHGPTPQKTAFFIVTAVKTSNPTKYFYYLRKSRMLLKGLIKDQPVWKFFWTMFQVLGFNSDDYFVGYSAMYFGRSSPTFRRNALVPSSESKMKPSKKPLHVFTCRSLQWTYTRVTWLITVDSRFDD